MDPRGVLELLIEGQYLAAVTNNNASSAMIRQMAAVGEPFEKAVAAALLSIGGPLHAPTTEARFILFGVGASDAEINERLRRGWRIPGFGNAFYKDKIDPAFTSFFLEIEKNHSEIWTRVTHVGSLITAARDRVFFPNAAAATAITAELLQVPQGTENQLLIMGRITAWAHQWSAK